MRFFLVTSQTQDLIRRYFLSVLAIPWSRLTIRQDIAREQHRSRDGRDRIAQNVPIAERARWMHEQPRIDALQMKVVRTDYNERLEMSSPLPHVVILPSLRMVSLALHVSKQMAQVGVSCSDASRSVELPSNSITGDLFRSS